MMRSLLIFLLGVTALSANSLQLFNDTDVSLKAMIYNASGQLQGEVILNPRDAGEWSDNDQNFGAEIGSSSQTPYSVTWICPSGSVYSSCSNVAAGALVTAQGCGGTQGCTPQTPAAPPPSEGVSAP